MKHRHHIVPKSRGGGDEAWNFHEKDAYDHAYDHALDFVLFEGAPVFDCRHEAWPLLPEDLRQLVREKLSLKMREMVKNQKGENHPQYGVRGEQSPNFGRKHTLASREKMSLALRGKPKTEEHKKKSPKTLEQGGQYRKKPRKKSQSLAKGCLSLKSTKRKSQKRQKVIKGG